MKLSVARKVRIREQKEQAALLGQGDQKLSMITRQAEVSLTRVPQHPNKVSRLGLVRLISCSQESESLVKFLVMRQVQGQAGKLNQQVRVMIRSKDSDLNQTQGQCLQPVCRPQRSSQRVRPQVRVRFGLMGYLARCRHKHGPTAV